MPHNGLTNAFSVRCRSPQHQCVAALRALSKFAVIRDKSTGEQAPSLMVWLATTLCKVCVYYHQYLPVSEQEQCHSGQAPVSVRFQISICLEMTVCLPLFCTPWHSTFSYCLRLTPPLPRMNTSMPGLSDTLNVGSIISPSRTSSMYVTRITCLSWRVAPRWML